MLPDKIELKGSSKFIRDMFLKYEFMKWYIFGKYKKGYNQFNRLNHNFFRTFQALLLLSYFR